MKDINQKPWIKVPLSEITVPKEGRVCCCNRWWVVTPDDHVLFYRDYFSKQCNSNRSMIERLIERLYPQCKAVYLEVAYVPQSARQ